MTPDQKNALLNKIITDKEDEISKFSAELAKFIKAEVFNVITGNIPTSATPTIFFTAGAPACGKSETVKGLRENYPDTVHIDPDEFRGLFPYYNGANAHYYQKSCTQILSHCFKNALKAGFDIIHDTNFAHEKTALDNVKEALKKGYQVQIMYVYMDPKSAWKHAQARDRKIKSETFCRNFPAVREVVKAVLSDPSLKGMPLACSAFIYIEQPTNGSFTTEILKGITADNLDVLVPFSYTASDLEDIAV